ncbi:hypothetical protein BGZ61DRAFT_375823 [Ilyonectria robusta]|uniref:uncharacterized protein n=1 Tax=Ilyonectria robusta TaxID=1079257 RepID=UPI001E8E550D|nr:uncharacterized protein BGZ61DRAFT_375823 [Ilyonectria robusta]KAH8650429.1 hypothetical protein BGZ61DRAFT_375823 [Ilyonectria robusta]
MSSVSKRISWVNPQKPIDNGEYSNCQSLPPILEFISGAMPSSYPPTPSSSIQPDSILPSPFAPAPRPYPEAKKHSSPQAPHLALSFSLRQDTLPTSDALRPPFSNLPSLSPASDRHPNPSSKPDIPRPPRFPEQRKPPRPSHQLNGVYAHPPPPPALVSYQRDRLPPGQFPLPLHSISTQHAILPPLRGSMTSDLVPHAKEGDYCARARYNATINGHFESSIYQDSLSWLATSSRKILNFAEAYSRIAPEQYGAYSVPERLPTERKVDDMLRNVELAKRWLEQVRDLMQTGIQTQRHYGRAKIEGPCEPGDGMMPRHSTIKFKKRGKLAATPGRCHSCNRVDTPEWRRGPDGARTLCNACGLLYARLERKRQLDARLIRPKSEGLRL